MSMWDILINTTIYNLVFFYTQSIIFSTSFFKKTKLVTVENSVNFFVCLPAFGSNFSPITATPHKETKNAKLENIRCMLLAVMIAAFHPAIRGWT